VLGLKVEDMKIIVSNSGVIKTTVTSKHIYLSLIKASASIGSWSRGAYCSILVGLLVCSSFVPLVLFVCRNLQKPCVI
jgi:hypothetical protein